MKRFRLILVGRTERGSVSDGVTTYLARIARIVPIDVVVLPEAGKGDATYQQRVEAARILDALRPDERVVVLDETGQGFSSIAFAGHLGAWRDQGVRQVVFVIGGAYGMTDQVRAKADLVMSLSPMTFSHQLVRVLFTEQLYRALTIIHGTPYHH